MFRLFLQQLCNDTKHSGTVTHCSKKSFLPQYLCLPFYSAPVDHISLASCIKMAEQGGQVCLKKQLKELSLYCQLLSSSALLTWDWSTAAGLLVPFVPASNPIWAGKERELQPKVIHSLIIFVFFWWKHSYCCKLGCPHCLTLLKF